MSNQFNLSDDVLRVAYDTTKAHQGNQTAAASALGISRSTMQNRLRLAYSRLNLPKLEVAAPKGTTVTAINPEEDQRLLSARADVQRYRKAYTETLKDRANEQRLIDLFTKSITGLPAIPASHFAARQKPTIKTGPRKPEVPVLLRGDQQIGEEITFEETYGINRYNFDVFQRRLEALEDRTLDILGDHQRADFPTLVVPYLGDNISGRIHVELQKYGHQHVVDQVYLGAAAEALFLYRLLKFGRWNEIHVPCVSGNHGRLDKEKESKRYYKNFDYLFTSIMATFLRNVPEIKFHIPQCLFTVVELAEHRILVSHGHELPPSSLGIPLYSINRASASYQELMALSGNERFQYWFMGHFHRPLELDGSFVNGTMAGLSEFGIGRFKPILPMQRLLGFHPKWGRAWEYPVRLDKGLPEQTRHYRFEHAMTTEDALECFATQTQIADKDAA
jgi:hypothetical protein